MKLKKILWSVLAFVVVLILSIVLFINSLKPTYSGEKELVKLSDKVTVYYDTYGVPHIYGENKSDAFRALGYVHAQDRLWQMEVLRRIGSGGLSEVFGKELLDTDKFFLSLGIDEASVKTIAKLKMSSHTVELPQAYLDGINQFIKKGPTPIEFYLTGIEKNPFVLKDIYNIIAYMAFNFAMAHKTDPLLTSIKENLGVAYLEDLEISVNPKTAFIKNYTKDTLDIIPNKVASLVSKALEKLTVPQFIGSNAWVIAPPKTKKGKVILANDPHISYSQPTVWYEAHIETPTYNMYGYHIGGIPFPLLGHNRKLAYGITMFENDDINFYYEEKHPTDSTKYKSKHGWKTYETVSKTIKVKDEEDVHFLYKRTIHGPILNGIADNISGDIPIAMSWIYTRVENKLFDAIYGMSHARNIQEFKKSLPMIHAPGLNIMYGDAEGNIAWWATAQLYQMPDSTNTKFFLDGSSGKQELLRYLDFSENPHAINPPYNYVYSANNQPDSINGRLYPGYYLPENRAKRIVDLLEPKNNWDKQSVSEMILDVTSAVNPAIIANLAKNVDLKQLGDKQIKMLGILNSWDGNYPVESIEATVFHRWIYFFLKNTFKDELGEDRFKQFLSTHFHKRVIAPMAAKEKSVWWDDVRTKDTVETQNTIVHISFVDAFKSLEKDFGKDSSKWTWNKVHTLEHRHSIGKVAIFRSFFNVGPFPVSGTREVINNLAFPYDKTGLYKVTSGPSTRRIIDFSDIENSISISPTGQSGNPFSTHYKDQAEMYINGEFRKMLLNKEEIIAKSKDVLILKPAEK